MTDAPRADPDAAAEIATAAVGFDWTWAADDVDRFCAVVGWEPSDRRPNRVTVTTKVDVERPSANFRFFKDKISEVSVNITDIVGESGESGESGEAGEAAQRFRTDAFAAVSRRLVEVLGQPARRIPGAEPKLFWATGTVVVKLSSVTTSLKLVLISPEYQQFTDDVAELERS